LRVFENEVLRKIFGPNRKEVTGEWRRPHNEKLYDFCSSSNISLLIKLRKMRWVGDVVRVKKRTGIYSALVGNTRDRPLGTPTRRCKEDFKVDFQSVEGDHGLDWSGSR
jgi:hypothetical protein